MQVDLLLKQHQNMLKALYSRYRLKPSGGGLRPKVLKLDGWLALMTVSQHILDQVAGAVLSYCWDGRHNNHCWASGHYIADQTMYVLVAWSDLCNAL